MSRPIIAGPALAAALALSAALPAQADAEADLAALRQELQTLRAGYEARLQALEQRLQAAEARAAAAPAAAQAAPAGATAAAAAPPPAPAATPTAGANAFNPAVSLILSGLYTRTSRNPADYTIAGFPLPTGAEIGPGSRGFSLAESELGLAANIDPWWRGAANLAFHGDDSVSVEEAYVQTTALGNGLGLKAGRFLSGIGYLNGQHAHTWDFVDAPLAYQAMLGGQLGDDGVQLTWLAPTALFLELGAELGRGRAFPGGDNARNGAGRAALTLHAGGDIGASQSWRAGLSAMSLKADDQTVSGLDATGLVSEASFSGRTRVWIADAVWKWAPNGNATRQNFKLQGEIVQARRSGVLTSAATGTADGYRALQSGAYLQGVWQFMPGWRVGLRTERLDAGTPDYGLNAGLFAASGFKPGKNTLMLDWSPSEFSRVRLQFARDRSRDPALGGGADSQLMLQYQMSLGAHGAHSY